MVSNCTDIVKPGVYEGRTTFNMVIGMDAVFKILVVHLPKTTKDVPDTADKLLNI